MKNLFSLKNKVIIFTSALYNDGDYETIPFEENMKAKVLYVSQCPVRDNVYTLTLDMSDFVEENSKFLVNNWYSTCGNRCSNWYESEFFPKNGKMKISIYQHNIPFKVVK